MLRAACDVAEAEQLGLGNFGIVAALGGRLVAVLRPPDHVERGPRRPVAVEHLQREILRRQFLLDRLQPQPNLPLHHALAGAVAGERTADEIVRGGVADVLDDGWVDVAQIDESAGKRLGVGGRDEANCHDRSHCWFHAMSPPASWPGLSRPSTSFGVKCDRRSWIPGTSPGMTEKTGSALTL